MLISFTLTLHVLDVPDPATAAANQANKEEVDARSVFVGNVRLLSSRTLCIGHVFPLTCLLHGNLFFIVHVISLALI